MNQDTAVDIAAHLILAHQYEQAESLLIPAIQNQPNATRPWQLLAKLSVNTGKYTQGLFAAWQANSRQPSGEMQALFAYCLNHVAITAYDPQLQTAVALAIAESWGAPAELAEQASKLLKLDPLIQPHLQNTRHLLTGSEIRSLNQNRLLNALLQSAPVCDLELEHFLTKLRKTLLLNLMLIESASELTASLAQQCFINEYIYPVSGPETAAIKELSGIDYWLILACYQPLHTLPEPAALLTQAWPESLQAVIQQQIIEPRQEAELAAALPALTSVSDSVSQVVQAMYEESPYPRWVKVPPFSNPQPLNSFLAQNYPLSGFTPLASDNPLQVLIAGGGTGQHPLHTARRFAGAQVQVIDLSRRSLAYAQRKTQELGLDNLRFAQADLLQIGQINETFDLIESVGVLHHMANPWAGWEALLTRLKPMGLMKLGFYSQTARKNINQLRDFIKTEGFGNTPDAIRACRQHLIEHSQSTDIGDIFLLRDFYSTSACRDLLFHVQEHQLTLPEIEAFLQPHGLKFIGFETDANTLDAYHQQFPNDPSATNLSNWHQFEQDHPNTFISMYQFWLQKVA